MGGPYKICILYVLRRRDGERQNGWGGVTVTQSQFFVTQDRRGVGEVVYAGRR